MVSFFFQAEDGIRDLVRSRGLGDVYKRQAQSTALGEWDQGPSVSPKWAVFGPMAPLGTTGNGLSLIHI